MRNTENTEFPFGLSLTELAILEYTNDDNIIEPTSSNIPQEAVVLTTKAAYIWAGAIAYCLEKDGDLQWRDFRTVLQNLLREYKSSLTKLYNFTESRVRPDQSRPGDYASSVLSQLGHTGAAMVTRGMLTKFFTQILKITPSYEILDDSIEETLLAYKSLEKKGLIEDPIFESLGIAVGGIGIAVAILGLIPQSFTHKTDQGKAVYRQIKAQFWSYEMQRDGEKKTTNVHINLIKILSTQRRNYATS